MVQHISNDGKGEVRIYAALDGCTCAWCESQRRTYAAQGKRFGDDDGSDGMTPQEAGVLLDKYARQLQREEKSLDYLTAFHRVCEQYPAVAKFYSGSYDEVTRSVQHFGQGGGVHEAETDGMSAADAGLLLDKAAKKIQAANEHFSYKECFIQARQDNPEWASAYDRVGRIA